MLSGPSGARTRHLSGHDRCSAAPCHHALPPWLDCLVSLPGLAVAPHKDNARADQGPEGSVARSLIGGRPACLPIRRSDHRTGVGKLSRTAWAGTGTVLGLASSSGCLYKFGVGSWAPCQCVKRVCGPNGHRHGHGQVYGSDKTGR